MQLYRNLGTKSLMQFMHHLTDEYDYLLKEQFLAITTHAKAGHWLSQHRDYAHSCTLFSLCHPPKAVSTIVSWLERSLPNLVPHCTSGIMRYGARVIGINDVSLLGKNTRCTCFHCCSYQSNILLVIIGVLFIWM